MPQIFISYTSEDRNIKDRLVLFLNQMCFNTWNADRDIISGNCIVEIFDNLQKSDYFLLVMSKDSKDSKWVEAETYAWFAIEKDSKRFLPFRIDQDHKREHFHPKVADSPDIIYDQRIGWDATEQKLKDFFSKRNSSNSGNRWNSPQARQNSVTSSLINIFLNGEDEQLLWKPSKKAYEDFFNEENVNDEYSNSIKTKLDNCPENSKNEGSIPILQK